MQSRNVQLVLDILKNEVDGDITAALEKMSDDYTMTWMYQGKKELFPSSGKDVKKEIETIYAIKGRKYDIRNITENETVVMVEMIESYPDPETKKVYKTPQVIVLEMENGKIKKGRHYCDPTVSHLELSDESIESGFKGVENKIIIQ